MTRLLLKPEEFIHMTLVAELRIAGWDGYFFHPPNESRSTARYRGKLKALGLLPGVADLVFIAPPPCGGYVAAALEIKADKGRASPEQKLFLERAAAAGWATACTRGLDASRSKLREWGYLG
jgi:hypothetical protein